MPDLGPAVGALAQLAAPLLGTALKAFLATTFGMIAAGVCVAVGSTWFLWSYSASKGLLAFLCALIVFTIAGFVMAGHRAVGKALLEGLRRAQLGGRTVRAVFQAMADSRGGEMLGSLPLAQAEKLLRDVVNGLLAAAAQGGGLKGKLSGKMQRSLLEKVESLTVTRFRAEGAGGIDLNKVGEDLAVKADDAIADRVQGVLTKMTVLIFLAACAAQAVIVFAMYKQVTRAGG